MTETHLAVFKGKKNRRTLHNNEWWFSIIDVCWALTESADAGAYWRKLKQRLKEEGSEVVTFCHGPKTIFSPYLPCSTCERQCALIHIEQEWKESGAYAYCLRLDAAAVVCKAVRKLMGN